MTDSEFPETPRGTSDETGAESRASLVPTSGVPSDSAALVSATAPGAAQPGFVSRREAREAGAYRAVQVAATPRPRLKRPFKRTRTRDAVRARLAATARTPWRRRLSSAGVMTVIVGLFASLTLPAFAEQNPLADSAR